jgi:hypothetical protein
MKLTDKQKEFLDKVLVRGTWSINSDTGLVDVEGSVNMSDMNLTDIPVKFGEVTVDFDCRFNKLTTLEGVPQSVGSNFYCQGNQLTSLVNSPQLVGREFICSYNRLTSLKGAPQSVDGDFNCYDNQLTSLVGAPQSVSGNFICIFNQLTSLEGAPQSVGGGFNCRFNQLTSLEGAPHLVGGLFVINLGEIDKNYYPVIIPEIEELISKGINLYKPDEYYHPYKEIHYKNKLIELL